MGNKMHSSAFPATVVALPFDLKQIKKAYMSTNRPKRTRNSLSNSPKIVPLVRNTVQPAKVHDYGKTTFRASVELKPWRKTKKDSRPYRFLVLKQPENSTILWALRGRKI